MDNAEIHITLYELKLFHLAHDTKHFYLASVPR